MSNIVKDIRLFVGTQDVLKNKDTMWRSLVAEFVGTLMLVLIGCFSCIHQPSDGPPNVVQIALCFGITVATIAQVSDNKITLIFICKYKSFS